MDTKEKSAQHHRTYDEYEPQQIDLLWENFRKQVRGPNKSFKHELSRAERKAIIKQNKRRRRGKSM